MNLNIPVKSIINHYKVLEKIGNIGSKPEDGFLRASWSDEESNAMEYFKKEAEKIGMKTRYDKVGNLFITTDDNNTEIVQVGSHLDTVPGGGNYDGSAGIVTGFEAIKAIVKSKIGLNKKLELVIWRGEESGTFGVVYKGSKAAFGKADSKILERKFKDKILRDAIKKQGFEPSNIENKISTINQDYIDKISAHIELHIEQGNMLEINKKDIGIVTSIRGPKRFIIVVKGRFDHSGATPMGKKYRKDTNIAISKMIIEIDNIGKKKIDQGKDLVQTIGIINSDKDLNNKYKDVELNAITKVSGFGYFTLDIRSNNNSFLDKYSKEIIRTIEIIGKREGVNVKIERIGSSNAIEKLSEQIQKEIEAACKNLGYKYNYMPSGAGHDITVVADAKKSNGKRIKCCMIFIPCKEGISHSKEEYSSPEEITKGANVLAQTIYNLAK